MSPYILYVGGNYDVLYLESEAPSPLLSTGVVSTLARNVKTCVLRLCPDRVCFVIMERGPAGGSNIWCELTQVDNLTAFLLTYFIINSTLFSRAKYLMNIV